MKLSRWSLKMTFEVYTRCQPSTCRFEAFFPRGEHNILFPSPPPPENLLIQPGWHGRLAIQNYLVFVLPCFCVTLFLSGALTII